MKSLITLLALAVGLAARAQSLNVVTPLPDAFSTLSTNYVFGTFTNATATNVLTLRVDGALYHTFHFYGATNFQYAIARSLDNTNYYYGATNAVTPNVVSEATITGKETWFRLLIQGTNVVGGINYLGGR
jgi:hypothetical protein